MPTMKNAQAINDTPQGERDAFTCMSCGGNFDRKQALAFTLKITTQHPNSKHIHDEGKVCGKKCLMDALSRLADELYGIRTGIIHEIRHREHIKGGHHIENHKTSN